MKQYKQQTPMKTEIHLGTKKAFGNWVMIITGAFIQIIKISKMDWDSLKKEGLNIEG